MERRQWLTTLIPHPPQPRSPSYRPLGNRSKTPFEAGVITDIIQKLAALEINSPEAVCGTSYEFLASLLDARIDLIREQLAVGSFGRGGWRG